MKLTVLTSYFSIRVSD